MTATRSPKGNGSAVWIEARGKWRLRWRDNHQTRQVYFAGTKTEADARLRAIVADRDAGIDAAPADGRVTVGGWLEVWQRDYVGAMTPGTRARYGDTCRLYLSDPVLSRTRLSDLTPDHVAAFHVRLKRRGLAENHRAVILATLSSALSTAIDAGRVRRNAVKELRKSRPRQHSAPVDPVAPADVDRLLADVVDADPRTRALYFVAIGAGLRQGETIGLKWSDIRQTPDGPVLRVERQVEYRTRAVETPKAHSTRSVPIAAGVVEALESLRRYQMETGRSNRDGFVFTTTAGKPIHPRNVLRDLHERCARLGIRRLRWHDLRHAYATRVSAAGTDLYGLMKVLGHKNAATTARYAHGSPIRDDLVLPAIPAAGTGA